MKCQSLILTRSLDEGVPDGSIFRVDESDIDVEAAKQTLQEGDMLVQLLVASADPYLRGHIKSVGEVKPGSPMHCFVVGRVLASRSGTYGEGDLFGAQLDLVTVQVVTRSTLARTLHWKLTGYVDESNITYGVGILGMPGSTAYGGVSGILCPKEGETLFVSAASGAVGGLVGMIAKHIYKCKVIGSCGGEDKSSFIKSFYDYDHAIDYKQVHNAEELAAKLKEVAPQGIDMYFENVGGMHFDAAYDQLRPRGRIAICGMISEYNKLEPPKATFNVGKSIYAQVRIEGFLCHDWLMGRKGNFLEDMSRWLKEGVVKAQETVFNGIDQWPAAFQSLFTGTNLGKVVIRL
eukprot:gene27050-32685_t